MYPAVLFILSAWFSPQHIPAKIIADLGAAKFAVRERAEQELNAQMTYLLALRLERCRTTSPEAQRRINRLVFAWWATAYPCYPDTPYIDSLCTPNCEGCKSKFSRRYMFASRQEVESGPPHYWEYRMAADRLYQDLRRTRIHPILFKPLVWWMNVRSAEWDRKRGYVRPVAP